MNLRQRIKHAFTGWFAAWLEQRQPAAQRVELTQSLLYVFPTAYGGWFLLLTLLLYLFGSNYQNNLILLCAYLLLSLFCFCILAAFFNLHRLVLSTDSEPSGFAGQPLPLRITLNHTQAKKMLECSGPDFAPMFFQYVPEQLLLELHPKRRGIYQLQRFKLQSCYPFGLIRCWTHVKLQQNYWFYPEPLALHRTSVLSGSEQRDNPDQLAPYQAGDPVSSVDWKRLAKNPWQPVVRRYSTTTSTQPQQELRVTATGAALELQLSEFCALLQHYEQQGSSYGLITPTRQIEPDRGQNHLHRCLQALSLC